VSFKLETDPNILISKATGAITKYGVDCVIANLLHTRNSEVQIVARRKHVRCGELGAMAGGPVEAEAIEGGEFEKVLVSVSGQGAGGGGATQIERPLVSAMTLIHGQFMSAS
jgi:phosphopantothenate-cysteine ligase